jgi:condensin-2 complex subunit G2
MLAFSVVVLDLSSDKSSAEVRAASVDTVSVLLGTDRSHGVVRPLLPSLGNLIHDNAEKVRLAVVRMLIRIKTVQGIRFYHVVPADQLLARLIVEADIHANSQTAVTKELTSLLMNSYLPQGDNVSASEQLKRTLTFLLTHPGASAVFYANVAAHLELESVVKLILVLLHWLKSAVEMDQAAQLQESQISKKRHHSQPFNSACERNDDKRTKSPDLVLADDTRLMASLSNVINVLWESITRCLNEQDNSSSKTILEGYFSGKDFNLPEVLSHFERKGSESPTNKDGNLRRDECYRTCGWMLTCASRLGKKCSRTVIAQVSTALRCNSNQTSKSRVPLVISYISFLCTNGFANDITTSLARSIESSFTTSDFSLLSPSFDETSVRRRSRRASTTKTNDGFVPSLSPSIGWDVIDSILQGVDQESKKIREIFLASDAASSALMDAFRKGIQHAEFVLGIATSHYGSIIENDEVEFVVRACEAYGRFALHKQSYSSLKIEEEVRVNQQVEMLVNWTTKIVVPAMLADDKGSSGLQDLDLSHISNTSDSLFHLPPGSPSLTSPPKQKQNRGRTPEAMRGHSSLFGVPLNDTPMTTLKSVAASLLASSCLISSELVAMGVSVPEAIATACVDWCDVFEDLNASMLEALLPAFTRLGVQLKVKSGSTTLLERLFVVCDKYLTGADCNTYVVLNAASRSILGRKRQEIESFVSLFLTVVDQIVGDRSDLLPIEKVDHMAEAWPAGGSIAIFLDAIDNNKHTQLFLAQTLATSLLKSDKREQHSFLFKVKCLTALSGLLEKRVFLDILEGLGYENIDGGNGIEILVKNLIEGRA